LGTSGRHYAILEARGLVEAAGPDARTFLQGMVSADLDRLSPERALWAAFLTPQGKFLHEFFLTLAPGAPGPEAGEAAGEDRVLLDCEAARIEDLRTRLGRYKLRARVTLEDVCARYAVAAVFGAGALEALGLPAEAGRAAPFAGGLVHVDPRLPELGARAVLPKDGAEAALQGAGLAPAGRGDYDALRIGLGVPDGSRDLEVERATLLENGFDELGGIDWDKGCFMGQELTARTKYRGLVKKRLVPVEIDGPAPAPGTPVTADGKDAGVLRSVADGLGLALIRLEHLETPLSAGAARLTARKPDWMKV
jgi:folate-binding protein YgfZ